MFCFFHLLFFRATKLDKDVMGEAFAFVKLGL